jgi:hypothetical protein
MGARRIGQESVGGGGKDRSRGRVARVWSPAAWDQWDEARPPQRECHALSNDLVTVHKRFVAMKRFHSLSSSNHAKIPFLLMCHPI